MATKGQIKTFHISEGKHSNYLKAAFGPVPLLGRFALLGMTHGNVRLALQTLYGRDPATRLSAFEPIISE